MFFSDTEKISLSAVRRLVSRVGREDIWDLINVRMCDRIGTGRPKESPYRLRKYKSMIDEVMSDPVSVTMLDMNGNTLMKELNLSPGPKIGHILHALLEEVLEDPTLNKRDVLLEKARKFADMSDADLKKIGEKGKLRKNEEEDRKVKEIREKHWVK